MLTEAPSALPGVIWWTACEVYTWVAFGEARKLSWIDDEGKERWADHVEFPRAEWSCDWVQWPPHGLSAAFVEIVTGKRPPCEPDPFGLENPNAEATREYALSWAHLLIGKTGESAGRLNELLAADIGRCICNQEKLQQAYRHVMAAVRAGRLTVRARRALKNGLPNVEAKHEILDPFEWFLGPRAINIRGEVDYTGKGGDPMIQMSPEALFDYKGPRWDDAQFIAGQVQALWPATPTPAAPSATETALAAETTVAAERRFTAWLVKRIKKAPDNPPGKPAIQSEAKAVGFNVSARAFARAWAKAVQEANAPAWSSPGRKSRRRIETPT